MPTNTVVARNIKLVNNSQELQLTTTSLASIHIGIKHSTWKTFKLVPLHEGIQTHSHSQQVNIHVMLYVTHGFKHLSQ